MSAKITKIGKSGSVKMDTAGLKALIDSANLQFVVRVGILGSKGVQGHQRKQTGERAAGGGHKVNNTESALTNAEIGLAHEKGIKSKNLPRRSWLEDPLRDKLPEYFQKLGADAIATMLQAQPIRAYEELGLVCEQIILKGFETGGYGKWRPLKPATIRNKGSDAILIDTAQLKKSVTSEVVTK